MPQTKTPSAPSNQGRSASGKVPGAGLHSISTTGKRYGPTEATVALAVPSYAPHCASTTPHGLHLPRADPRPRSCRRVRCLQAAQPQRVH